MPTDSRTAVCSLTTPAGYSRGMDQPPNSANFAPRATWRSCSGDCLRVASGHGPKPTPAPVRPTPDLKCPGDHDVHAAQRQPRQDPCGGRRGRRPRLRQGPRRVRRGRRRRRGLGPQAGDRCSPSLGVTGKAGESVRLPTQRHHQRPAPRARRSRQGAGRDGRTPCCRRRRPERAQRRVGRDRAARRHARPGRCGHAGPPARRLHLHVAQVQPPKDATAEAGDVVVLSPVAAQGRGDRCLRGGAGARRRRAPDPRLGQRAARPPARRPRSPTRSSTAAQGRRPRAAARPR